MDKLAYIPLVLISILSLVWGANKRGPEKPECLEVGINIDADSTVPMLERKAIVGEFMV